MTEQIPETDEQNWLVGLCDYTGPSSDLPLGGYSKVPNWLPEDIVKRIKVLDAEIDEGYVWKMRSELKPDDILIGLEQNQNSIQAVVDMYGRDFYQIREANGTLLMTLDEWQVKFHSNGLGLVALRNLRMILDGTMPATKKIP